jgi:ABC-2 type transport system permease protein
VKTFSVARKTLLELWREPALSGLFLLFPALLVAIYFFAFGQTDKGLAGMLKVIVVNQDRGPSGAQFVEAVRAQGLDGEPVFAVEVTTDRRTAETAVWERKATLVMVIPPDFSQTLQSEGTAEGTAEGAAVRTASPAPIQLLGEPTSDNFVFAGSLLSAVADQFGQGIVSTAQPSTQSPALSYEYMPGTGTLSDLQIGIPGCIVFGITFGILIAATIAVRMRTSGTLQRLRLTRVRAGDLLIGIALANMVLALVQLPITYGVAVALGFRSPGAVWLMLGIGTLLSLAATGLGLITACLARTDGEVAGLGSAMVLPLVFLSGALFSMPPLPLATIGGVAIEAYDFMPTTHAVEALRRVMIYGDGPQAIGYELLGLVVLSGLYLACGIFLYQRLQLRRV